MDYYYVMIKPQNGWNVNIYRKGSANQTTGDRNMEYIKVNTHTHVVHSKNAPRIFFARGGLIFFGQLGSRSIKLIY